MDTHVPLRERVLAAAMETPSVTRPQGRRFALLGVAISGTVAAGLWAIVGGIARGDPSLDSGRLAAGWALAACALTWVVLGRGQSTLVRSPSLLAAATWASPVVLLLWMPRFSGADAAWLTDGAECFGLSLALAAAPLATFLALRRGAEPYCPGALGAGAGAMCGAWAQVLTLLWCPTRGLAHAAIGHALPVAVLAATGGLVGRRALRTHPITERYLRDPEVGGRRRTGVTGVRLLAPPWASLGLARFWDAFATGTVRGSPGSVPRRTTPVVARSETSHGSSSPGVVP